MKAKDIYGHCKGKNRIAIVGGADSGKTTLATELGELLDIRVLHTDDFISFGYVGALGEINKNLEPPVIVEGIQAVRVLRYGAIHGGWLADVVIDLGGYGDFLGLATILEDYKKVMRNNYQEHPIYIKDGASPT